MTDYSETKALRERLQLLENAIVAWWESLRPLGWDLEKHLAHPNVNATPRQADLAILAADIARRQRPSI